MPPRVPSRKKPRPTRSVQPLKNIQSAPIRSLPPLPDSLPERKTSFLDLPAELRIQIYSLILRDVIVHVLPTDSYGRTTSTNTRRGPHSLLLTSRQIRSEARPIIYTSSPIRAVVTDFDFTGLLTWLSRIPVEGGQCQLAKNPYLKITLRTGAELPGDLPTLRRWLHDRADACRPQLEWKYSGPPPATKVDNDLRRRLKRMKEVRKQAELRKMVKAVGVYIHEPRPADSV